jgi:hypothetical protein
MEKLERIEQYLEGKLPLAEQEALEAEMKADPALQEEVASVRDLIQGIERAEEKVFAQQLKDWEEKIQAEKSKPKDKIRSLQSQRRLIRMAAAFMILIALVFLLLPGKSDPQELFAQHFQPYQDKLTTMGEGPAELDQELSNQAMAFYNAGAYAEALPLLQTLRQQAPDMSLLKLYLGIAAMQSGQQELARQSLASLAESNTAYQAEAQWYLGLSYLKAGKTPAAREQLQSIQQDSNNPYQTQAREVLNALE